MALRSENLEPDHPKALETFDKCVATAAPTALGSDSEDAAPHHRQPGTIQAMFDSIAGRYDLANSVLSFGIHHWWRRQLVRASKVRPNDSVFDAATGTGDLALAFAKKVGPGGTVIGGDFSEAMLACARVKQGDQMPWLRFQTADVMSLPFEDASFEVVSISFGIRNVSDPQRGIAELWRVLKPGGVLLVLEFGSGAPNLWGALFRWYSKYILPVIGGFVTGKPGAYAYLERSSAQFPSRDAFADLMKHAGAWKSVTWKSLTGGIAFLYIAQK